MEVAVAIKIAEGSQTLTIEHVRANNTYRVTMTKPGQKIQIAEITMGKARCIKDWLGDELFYHSKPAIQPKTTENP